MSDNGKEQAHSNASIKQPISEEERLALADKLDKDLDVWINSLEKKTYTDGWAEDKWQEEMEKHPFFMTQFPDDPSKASPLLQGIQQLKYDETANSPLELAQSYKEDGNFNFKHKKYRMAVLSYTEGLRRKCGDSSLESALYNNRSAAQFFLKNYRSSLMDSKNCLKLNPNHTKAEVRAIQCLLKLSKPQDALDLCDSFLKKHEPTDEINALRKEAQTMLKTIQRDKRKEERSEKKESGEINRLKAAIADRKVAVEVDGDPDEVLFGMHEKPKLQSDGSLTWPVFFLYPEYSTSDFIQEFSENNSVITMLEEVFADRPDWDVNGSYYPGNLNVYYETDDRSVLKQVDVTQKLCDIIKQKGFVARDWRPAFLIFVKNSKAEEKFIKNYTVDR